MKNILLTREDILRGLALLDFSDIEFLAREANIRDTESALNLIEAFYPASREGAKAP